ncbi:MAG: diaminopimelate decarboxylase [Lautropia sp.]
MISDAATLPDWIRRDADGRLVGDDLPFADLAERFGTPTYVYSRTAIERTWRAFERACEGRNVQICYAMKANSTLGIVDCFARLGAGFDIVSAGELERVLAVGAGADRVIFSGVGKSGAEIRRALEAGVHCFNVESESELARIDRIAGTLGMRAPISLRVNPDVDAATHPYISTGLKQNKFGIAHEKAVSVYLGATRMKHVEVVGIDCHIGSQITEIAPFLAALDKVLALVDELRSHGITMRHLDLGGGLGIRYDAETPPSPQALMDAIFARIDAWCPRDPPKVLFEFGRALVGEAGVLLTRVEYLKENHGKRFAVVDASMSELLRPALYQAWHGVAPVLARAGVPGRYDLVGPVCESGDWLAKDRALVLEEGDLLVLLSAGAYGAVMSSNYNTRTRPAELLVAGGVVDVLRPRETVASLLSQEQVPGR